MFLAQLSSADPVHLWNLLMIAGYFVTTMAAVVGIVVGLRKQKREVTFGDSYITKEFCASRHEQTVERVARMELEMAAIREDMKADRQEHNSALLREVGKVHDRVNAVLAAVSELAGQLKQGLKR